MKVYKDGDVVKILDEFYMISDPGIIRTCTGCDFLDMSDSYLSCKLMKTNPEIDCAISFEECNLKKIKTFEEVFYLNNEKIIELGTIFSRNGRVVKVVSGEDTGNLCVGCSYKGYSEGEGFCLATSGAAFSCGSVIGSGGILEEIEFETLDCEKSEVENIEPTKEEVEQNHNHLVCEEEDKAIVYDDKEEESDVYSPTSDFGEIADRLCKFVHDKNIKYDGAFDKAVDKFGESYFVSKIFEKYSRLEYMHKNKTKDEETIEDTIKDIFGYCLLMLIRNYDEDK